MDRTGRGATVPAHGQYLRVDLGVFRESLEFTGPSPTDPAMLQQIAVPVLLLYGTRTATSWFTEGIFTAPTMCRIRRYARFPTPGTWAISWTRNAMRLRSSRAWKCRPADADDTSRR